MRNSKMKGFTLIELIVVIAIIGVLAAILVPSMIGYVGESKLATANSNAKLVYTNTATYATQCEVAGYPLSGSASADTDSTKKGGTVGPIKLTYTGTTPPDYKKDGTELGNALRNLMGSESASAGICYVRVSDAGTPAEATWAKTEKDQYAGHYPGEYTTKGGKLAISQTTT